MTYHDEKGTDLETEQTNIEEAHRDHCHLQQHPRTSHSYHQPCTQLRVPHNIWTDYFNTNPDDFWKLYCLCNDTASGYQGSYRNNLKNYVEIIAARLFALLYTLTTVATRRAISTIPCQKLTIARPGRGPSTFLPTVEKPTAFLIQFILYQRVDVQKEVAIGYIRGMHARRCEGVLYLNNRQRN